MKMPSDESPDSIADSYLPGAESVRDGLKKLDASAEQIELVLWLLSYGQEKRGAKSRGDLGRLIGVASSTISKVFSGTYEGSLDSVVSRIRNFRGGAGANPREWPVADLRIGREIASFCDAVRGVGQIGFLWGPNQSGKSFALEQYAAQPRKERTFYVFIPAGGATRGTMNALAASAGLPVTVNYQAICDAATGFFRQGDLIIWDEYHQPLMGDLKKVTVEKIKEIYERTGASAVLCGTHVMQEKMNDPKLKAFLGQTSNRGALRRNVPIAPYKADIQAAFVAYGFPRIPTSGPSDVRDKVDAIATEHGLGRIFRLLQVATRYAKNKKAATPTHEHFMTSVRTMETWAAGTNPNDKWEDS